MFTKYISKNIQQKLEAKKRALERKPKPQNDDDSRKGYLSFRDIATRTAFVRMCSNKVEPIFNKLIEGGLRDNNGDKRFGFDRLYSKEGQRKPTSGIKNIEVSYKGGFKAIRECVVTWVVPSLKELNELTPFFFTIGKTVVVDWGWVYSNQNYDEQLSDTFIQRVLKTDGGLDQQQTNQQYMYKIQQDIFTNPQPKILEKDGDYDAIGGQISNFSYNLREDGGFDCTTKIISLGNSLFKRPLDMGANRAGLKVSKNDDGKKTYRQLPPDSLINAIINLKEIIFTEEFRLDEVGQKVGSTPYSVMEPRNRSNEPAMFFNKVKKDYDDDKDEQKGYRHHLLSHHQKIDIC